MRLRGLPPAARGEDPVAALAAQERLAAAARRAREIHRQERERLAAALVRQRRWAAAGWRGLIAHPAVSRLAQALFWEVEGEGGAPGRPIRVAEDGTLVDAAEDPVVLGDGAAIRLLHPARHTPEILHRLSGIMLDYRLIAPFPQLDLEVYRPTADEAGQAEIGRPVPRERLTALTSAWGIARWVEPRRGEARTRYIFLWDRRVSLRFSPALTDALLGSHTLERVVWEAGADPAMISEAVLEARRVA